MSRNLDCLPGLMYGAPGDLISFLIKCHVIKKDALFYFADIQLTAYLKTPGGASSSLVSAGCRSCHVWGRGEAIETPGDRNKSGSSVLIPTLCFMEIFIVKL